MPIYEYECRKCGHRFDVLQSFSDPPVKTCRHNGCRGRVQKLLSPPAIIYKGSGFYTTDYAKRKSPGSTSTESKGTEKAPATADSGSPKTADSEG